jgi:enamine deaminase RidA (YjgF/YER057c/UK114 family)
MTTPSSQQLSTRQTRLAALAGERPPAPALGRYRRTRRQGDTLWIAGHTGRRPGLTPVSGVVGLDVDPDVARAEAAHAAVNLLLAVDDAVGLDAVEAVLHLRGYVRAVGTFTAHPTVVDGASDVLVDVLGEEAGAHARSALGVASLPGGAPVELELVVALIPGSAPGD